MTDEIRIRRAAEVDIPLIGKLLLQVHRVHSDVRPDLFRKGGKNIPMRSLRKSFPMRADRFLLRRETARLPGMHSAFISRA